MSFQIVIVNRFEKRKKKEWPCVFECVKITGFSEYLGVADMQQPKSPPTLNTANESNSKKTYAPQNVNKIISFENVRNFSIKQWEATRAIRKHKFSSSLNCCSNVAILLARTCICVMRIALVSVHRICDFSFCA